MKHIKKIVCALIAFTTVLSQVGFAPVVKDVYANESNVNVNLKVGQDYIINSGDITDDADGTVIDMDYSFDSFTKLYNHNDSGNVFSTTTNASIKLSDASFEFRLQNTQQDYSQYQIYNKKTNQYLVQSNAGAYFNSNANNMRVYNNNGEFNKV